MEKFYNEAMSRHISKEEKRRKRLKEGERFLKRYKGDRENLFKLTKDYAKRQHVSINKAITDLLDLGMGWNGDQVRSIKARAKEVQQIKRERIRRKRARFKENKALRKRLKDDLVKKGLSEQEAYQIIYENSKQKKKRRGPKTRPKVSYNKGQKVKND